MESTPGEDAVRIDEMTTEGLEYYINLVDKAEAGFERIDFSFERRSTLGKVLPNSNSCYRDIFHEESMDAANFLIILFKEIATVILSYRNHPGQSAAFNIEARASTTEECDSLEGSSDG